MTATELGREPSGLPPANLAGAFGPPDRSAALSGLLTPVRSVPAQPPAAATTDLNQPDSLSPHLPSRQRDSDADGSRPLTVIVYLPASLRDRLREAAATQPATYTELTLEALDATHARLQDLLGEVGITRRQDSLFTDSTARRRQRHNEPQVQVSLRLTPSQLAVIDGLTSRYSAPSRSALVAAALAEHMKRI